MLILLKLLIWFIQYTELESLEEAENSPTEDQDFHLDLDLSYDHDIDNDQVGDINMGDHNNVHHDTHMDDNHDIIMEDINSGRNDQIPGSKRKGNHLED